MKKPKHLNIVLLGAGHSVHIERWIQFLAGQDLNVTLISETILKEAPSNTRVVRLPGQRLPRVLRLLVNAFIVPILVRRLKPDIIQVHSLGSNALLSLALPRRGLVVTPWGSDIASLDPKSPRALLVATIVRRAERILTTSRQMRDDVLRMFNVTSDRVRVISWGVDDELYRPPLNENERTNERRKWDLPEDRYMILSNRTTSDTYRTIEVVAAFGAALKNRDDIHLVVLRGFTPSNPAARARQIDYRHKVSAAVESIADHVTMIDRPLSRSEVASLLRASNAVVSVPRADQRSTSVLEAIASGTNVILPNLPVYEELVLDGAQVQLVDDPLVANLSQTFSTIGAADRESVEANRRFIHARESWIGQAMKVLAEYESLAVEGV